jgi:hypothetical protein
MKSRLLQKIGDRNLRPHPLRLLSGQLEKSFGRTDFLRLAVVVPVRGIYQIQSVDISR